jgi:hypothetical protein
MDIPTHPAWGEDERIYFAQGSFIYRVTADGNGEPERFTTEKGWLPGFPTPLPEGRGLLLTTRHREHEIGRFHDSISVVGPGGGEPRALVEGAFARYSWSGHVVYTTWDGSLFAAPFDLESLEVTGASVLMEGGDPTVEAIETQYSGKGAFDLSRTGTFLYQTGGAPPLLSTVGWFEEGTVRPVDSTWVGHFTDLNLSPDASRFAVLETKEMVQEIWISTLMGARERIWTSRKAISGLSWTADGQAVSYLEVLNPSGDPRLPGTKIPFLKQVDSDELQESLLPQGVEITGDLIVWHPDGEWLVYSDSPSGTSDPAGIWASRLGTEDPPVLLVESTSDHHNLQPQAFSPDGRYLAYLAQELPREGHADIHQVWVVSFENSEGERKKIDTRPASRVRWSHDGNTLYFDSYWDNATMKIEVETDPTFSFGHIEEFFHSGGAAGPIEVLPDNQTFLLLSHAWLDQAAGGGAYWLVHNYFLELEERVGR